MNRTTLTVAPTATTANSVAASQTPLALGPITIDGTLAVGGVATFAAAQKVTVTSAGNDTDKTFTIVGTGPDGAAQTEVLTGASGGAATSAKYYKTVSSISASAATADAITAGNTVVAVSASIFPVANYPFSLGFGVAVGGTINYTVQHTYDDDGTYPTNWFSHATAVAKTASFDATYAAPITAARVLINSGTVPTVSAVFLQVVR